MKTDTLTTCDLCGQGNIYSKALKAHQRSKHCAESRGKLSPRPAAQTAEKSKNASKEHAGSPGKVSKGKPLTLARLDEMPAVPAAPEDEWENARRYSQMAEGFSQATVVAQVMCGFELIELQRKMCATRGGDRSKPNDLVLPWPKLVKEKINRSDETARNWMNMARAVQPKLKKLDGPWEAPTLLALPPSEWPDEARAGVEKTLKGICEGYSQVEFMRELGLTKKLPGNGGGHHPAQTPDTRTPEERAQESAQSLFHPLAVELYRGASEGEVQKLYHLPITGDAPNDITGLADLAELTRAFLRKVEAVLEDKKAAVRKGARK